MCSFIFRYEFHQRKTYSINLEWRFSLHFRIFCYHYYFAFYELQRVTSMVCVHFVVVHSCVECLLSTSLTFLHFFFSFFLSSLETSLQSSLFINWNIFSARANNVAWHMRFVSCEFSGKLFLRSRVFFFIPSLFRFRFGRNFDGKCKYFYVSLSARSIYILNKWMRIMWMLDEAYTIHTYSSPNTRTQFGMLLLLKIVKTSLSKSIHFGGCVVYVDDDEMLKSVIYMYCENGNDSSIYFYTFSMVFRALAVNGEKKNR